MPIPISPGMSSCAPLAAASSARVMPTSTARRQSAADIAGPAAILSVPRRTVLRSTPSCVYGVAIPTSTTRTGAPSRRAKALMVPPPRAKLTAWAAVTVGAEGEIPSAVTPLSAHTTTTSLWSSRGKAVRCMPARRMTASSNRPRLPGSLARVSSLRRAASRALVSGRRICAAACSIVILVTSTFR